MVMPRTSQVLVFAAATLFVLGSCVSIADDDREVSVHDGETLTVLIGTRQAKVRLAEIDAPELHLSHGTHSKESLAPLCFDEATALTPKRDPAPTCDIRPKNPAQVLM